MPNNLDNILLLQICMCVLKVVSFLSNTKFPSH